MRDLLAQLKTRATFEQQWPDTYRAAIAQGRDRALKLQSIRSAATDMVTILSGRPDVKKWWDQIE
jgi:hypothetical protein